LVATAVIAVAGCGADFDPYERLDKLRVLAIATEPVAPATGETTIATPLIYTAPGTAVTELAWSWCPFAGSASDGAPCLVTEAELAAIAGGSADDIPPYDLGRGDTASFENRLDPTLLAAVCAGMPGQPALLDCREGFPAQLELTVRTDAGEELTAIRTLRLRFDDATPANANPVIDDLIVDDVLVRDAEAPIRAEVSEDHAERYDGFDDDGNPAEQRERLVLSWFVESGTVDEARTGFIDGVTTLADTTDNTWQPALAIDYPGETAEVIVVIRDDREGVAWSRATVELQEAP